MWLCLQTQGKLLLANVNKENWSSNFFSQINDFWREHFQQVSYLLKILSMAKKRKNWLFNYCHEIKILLDFSWLLLWRICCWAKIKKIVLQCCCILFPAVIISNFGKSLVIGSMSCCGTLETAFAVANKSHHCPALLFCPIARGI